jgi:hypothetical protein
METIADADTLEKKINAKNNSIINVIASNRTKSKRNV